MLSRFAAISKSWVLRSLQNQLSTSKMFSVRSTSFVKPQVRYYSQEVKNETPGASKPTNESAAPPKAEAKKEQQSKSKQDKKEFDESKIEEDEEPIDYAALRKSPSLIGRLGNMLFFGSIITYIITYWMYKKKKPDYGNGIEFFDNEIVITSHSFPEMDVQFCTNYRQLLFIDVEHIHEAYQQKNAP